MKTARNGWWLISAGWILLTGPFLGSENIQLPEEYIYGQDLSVWKSEIMFLPAPEVKIDFPPLPLPEWSTEVPPVQEATAPETAASIARPLETFPVEPERERWVRVTAGQNQTLGLLWVHQDKTSSFSWSLSGGVENSAGWRAHQNKNISNLSCRLEPLSRYGPFFQVETLIGRQQLPGPLWAPLTEIRNTFGFSGWYQQQLEDHPFLLSARERYYQMDELQANYLKLAGKLTRQSWQWSSEVEWQEIKKAGSQTGLLTELALEKEAFSLGLGLKGIQGTGLRLLPRAEVHLNRNLKFSLTSYYQIADFWGEAGKSDYLEIKPERLKPQEGYRLAAGYLSSNSCGWFSFDAGYTWWNHFYTWSDQDGNFLYEPALIRHLWATDLNLRAGFKLTRDA
ncbi:MAG TPA: hypothetical protein PK644_07485, partial [bacterium]|nr:hypothetical protein [bacterium]